MSKWDFSGHSQSITVVPAFVSMYTQVAVRNVAHTLFAGFVFSFSNIFCDSNFVAMAAIFADLRQAVECALDYVQDGEEML